MFFNKKNNQVEKKKPVDSPSLFKRPLPFKNFSSEELANKLKELKESDKEIFESPGAMCYSTSYIEPESYICKECGESNKENGYWNYNIEKITNIVSKIKALGYDVKLDIKEFCPKCSDGKFIEKPELVFKIKYKGETEYHQVRTNIISDYKILLAFLENKDTYEAGRGQTIALKKELKVIEKMTGVIYGE